MLVEANLALNPLNVSAALMANRRVLDLTPERESKTRRPARKANCCSA